MSGAVGSSRAEEASRGIVPARPVPSWEADVSELVAHLESLNADGASDLRAYLDRHPEELGRCAELIRAAAGRRLDVEALQESQKTLETVIETAPS